MHIHTWPYDFHVAHKSTLTVVLFGRTEVCIHVAPVKGLFGLQQGNVSLQ